MATKKKSTMRVQSPAKQAKGGRPAPVSAGVGPVAQAAVLQSQLEVAADRAESAVRPRSGILLLTAVMTGLAFDWLFWNQIAGLNYGIFLVLCLLGGIFIMRGSGIRPAGRSLWLIAPAGLSCAVVALRQEPLTLFLGFALSLFSLGVLAVTFRGGRWPLCGLSDYLQKCFSLVQSMFSAAPGELREFWRERGRQGRAGHASYFVGLLRGLAIALPLVLCFGSLLASADAVFNQKIIDFLTEFDTERSVELLQRAFLITACVYLTAGVYVHSARSSSDRELDAERFPNGTKFLGFVETSVILACIITLFTLFVLIQFRYFFGGQANIGVTGYTYSEYARRGFIELVIVAFLSLVLILGLSAVTRRESEFQRKAHIGLNLALIVLVLIILASAFQRISLGIGWHGYSRLRLYPQIFLVWLALLLITVGVLELLRRERYFAFAVVMAVFGFAATLTLFDIDAATVRHNVYRAWHGKNLNVPHLSSLSVDAIPALAEEFLSPELPEYAREGVGAILACHQHFDAESEASGSDWRSFNLSRWRARQTLEELRPQLEGYVLKAERWPVRVRTPGNVLYDCEDSISFRLD